MAEFAVKCTFCETTIIYSSKDVFPNAGWECSECYRSDYEVLKPTAEDKAFEVIERKQCENQAHPLLNPESKHYSMVDGVEAICRMEQLYTTEELMVWAKMTAMKYRLRIGNKDDVLKEAKKIETYEAYYKYLEDKLKHEEIK